MKEVMYVRYTAPARFSDYSDISPSDVNDLSFHNDNSSLSCKLIIGFVIFIIIMVLLKTISKCSRPRSINRGSYISGRKAAVDKPDCHAKMSFAGTEVDNLTHCDENDDACKSFKSISNDVKKDTAKTVKEYDEKHENKMYMIYAPWCPHCHTALPKFCEASKKCASENVQFALVNAEMVTSDILQDVKNGTKPVFNVTHFPFLVHKTKNGEEVFKGAPSAENIAEFATKKLDAKEESESKDALELLFS